LAPKTGRIVGSVLVAGVAWLGFMALRPSAKVPEPEPTKAELRLVESPRVAGRAPPQAELELASAAVPIEAVGSASPPANEPVHPHPITPRHERIYRENQLTFSLDSAVDVEDVPGIRRLLAIYRQEFPEDSLVLQQGYELIANCLEQPGATTRAPAQRFYDTELASTLRRHVRRHCLEKP